MFEAHGATSEEEKPLKKGSKKHRANASKRWVQTKSKFNGRRLGSPWEGLGRPLRGQAPKNTEKAFVLSQIQKKTRSKPAQNSGPQPYTIFINPEPETLAYAPKTSREQGQGTGRRASALFPRRWLCQAPEVRCLPGQVLGLGFRV